MLLWQRMLDYRLEHHQMGQLVWLATTGWPPEVGLWAWRMLLWRWWTPRAVSLAKLKRHGLVRPVGGGTGLAYELFPENAGRLGFAANLESRQIPSKALPRQEHSEFRMLTNGEELSRLEQEETFLLWQVMLGGRLKYHKTGQLVWSPLATGWPVGWSRKQRWKYLAILKCYGLARQVGELLYELYPQNEGQLGFTADLESTQAVVELRARQARGEFGLLTGGKSTSLTKLEDVVVAVIIVLVVAGIIGGLMWLRCQTSGFGFFC